MQPTDSSDKARRLGRPMSSFSHKDMTLNDACPSVLGDHTDQQSMQSSSRVDGHVSMKISAPRHVFSKFQNSSPTETGCSSSSNAEVSGRQEYSMSSQPAAATRDAVHYADQFATGRLRVQFDNSKNEVTEYTPSSQGSPAHPLTAAWMSVPVVPSEQGSEVFEGPNPVAAEYPDLSPGPPSRHASNLALRAGTFDEIMMEAATQEPVALQPSLSSRFLSIRTNSGIPASTDIQISRRASNMNDRAGTFDELVSTPAASGPNEHVDSAGAGHEILPLIDIATSLDSYPPPVHAFAKPGTGYGAGTSLYAAPEEQDLSGSISRRYTNMCNAAGAFDYLVDEDGDVLSASESEGGEDSTSHAPTISFSGMLSGLPNHNEQSTALEPLEGMYWRSVTARDPHMELGMVPATIDAVGIAGVLPSDLCSEASEVEGRNPLSIDHDKSDPRMPFYMADDSAHAEHSPSMLGQWFEGSLGGERSDRSLRLTEINTRSLNPSRGSSAAPPSSRRTMVQESMPITAEHSTLSCTLSSTLSIKTPRAVLQKFSHADGDKLVSVLSTQEASARLGSMKFMSNEGKAFSSGFRTSDAENVPRVLPQHLQVVLPSEQEASAVEQAVLTPQEWLNKISNKVPHFPAAHMQLPGGQGKAMAVAPGGDTGTLTSRLGAFRPEEESLL